jgi:hypothetical protein
MKNVLGAIPTAFNVARLRLKNQIALNMHGPGGQSIRVGQLYKNSGLDANLIGTLGRRRELVDMYSKINAHDRGHAICGADTSFAGEVPAVAFESMLLAVARGQSVQPSLQAAFLSPLRDSPFRDVADTFAFLKHSERLQPGKKYDPGFSTFDFAAYERHMYGPLSQMARRLAPQLKSHPYKPLHEFGLSVDMLREWSSLSAQNRQTLMPKFLNWRKQALAFGSNFDQVYVPVAERAQLAQIVQSKCLTINKAIQRRLRGQNTKAS